MARVMEEVRDLGVMPVNFGSFLERGPDLSGLSAEEMRAKMTTATDVTAMAVSYLTDAGKLEALLPPDKGLSLHGDPVVSVSCVYQGQVAWLAGRGYNLIMVTFPVEFSGDKKVVGSFAPVIWENLCEPIIRGREMLGWSKIFCDIPQYTRFGDRMRATAEWEGFRFLDVTVDNIRPVTEADARAMGRNAVKSEGSIHHKYITRSSGVPGETDADYLVLVRPGVEATAKEAVTGDATIAFHRATWEEMPTQANIVNALADLEVKEIVSTMVVKNDGGTIGPVEIL